MLTIMIRFGQRLRLNPPKMVPTDYTFQARSNIGISVVFTKFDYLIDPANSITEVSRLSISIVNPKTFC